MRLLTTLAVLAAFALAPALAQPQPQPQRLHSGAISFRHMDDNSAQIDALHREISGRLHALGLDRNRSSRAAAKLPPLEFPLRLRSNSKNLRANGVGFFVDHDSGQGLQDYTCGQRTYNGHSGVDFVPFPFWWRMMDNEEVEVVAAAPGVIVSKHDNEFDRQCRFDIATANVVAVRQDDGLTAYYFHLKKGSLTRASVGSRVATGDYIGLVGSSGVSYVPHLHFELRDSRNTVVEPFFGACSRSATLWKQQTEDMDTDVLRVATQTSAPRISPGDFCSDPEPQYSDKFAPGSTVYAVAYVRDLQRSTPVTVSLIEPDGTVFATGTSGPDSLVDRMSFYYISRKLPDRPRGRWLVRAELEGKMYEHAFMVGKPPKPTAVEALVQPLARSVKTDETASFDVTVQNTGRAQAFGCALAPDAPLAAVWHYQAVVDGKPEGEPDQAFDLKPDATATFSLTFAPKHGFAAYGSAVPVRVVCNNSDASEPIEGVNVITLSFEEDGTPDILMQARKLPEGVVELAGAKGKAKLNLTATDAGISADLMITARASAPVTLQVCRMATRKSCAEPPADSALVSFRARTSETIQVTIKAKGSIPFDPVNNRIIVEATDALGIVRGGMSVAVTTDRSALSAAAGEP